MNFSNELSINEMQDIQGGTWQTDLTCVGSALLFVAACSSPVTWAAAVVVAGSGAVAIGSCW